MRARTWASFLLVVAAVMSACSSAGRSVAEEGLTVAIEDDSATQPTAVGPPLWTQRQQIVGSGEFGRAVAIDGDTAFVSGGGNVYVYTLSGPRWRFQQVLTVPGGGDNEFGYAIALSGDTAVVSAIFAPPSGTAYVFSRCNGVWTQEQELTPTDAPVNALFGWSVAASANTVLVASLTSGPSTVYAYVRHGTTWLLQQELTAGDTGSYDDFGNSVALEGDTVVVGAPGYPGDFNFVGAAIVFNRRGTSWIRGQVLTANNGAPGDSFGSSVALHGDTIVAGAPEFADFEGTAYVFQRCGAGWVQQQELGPSDASDEGFGAPVTVGNGVIVVGAVNGYPNTEAGAAYVFRPAGGEWSQAQRLAPIQSQIGDVFGCSLGLSGDTLLVGAYGYDSDQGAAYFFARGP